MADTLENIVLPANTWVNIYLHPTIVAAGITVGEQISSQNIGSTSIRLFAGATAPTTSDGYRTSEQNEIWVNDSGDAGAWFYSSVFDGLVNVRAE